MKKLISIFCALTVICGFASTAMAEGNGSISLSAEYYANDWATSQDKILKADDIVYVKINASDLPGADKITTECKQFSNVSLKVTYDKNVITPYEEGGVYSHIELNQFTAKYTMPNKKVPTADTIGLISTGAVSPVSNVDEPGYVADGTTTIILNNGIAGFTLKGDFITLYFKVVNPAAENANPNVGLEVTAYDNYDESASVLPATTGVKLEGVGSSKTPYTIDDEAKSNKDEVAEGEKYTQGFKATVTPNDDVVTAVKAVLANGTKTADVEWTGSYEGATPITFAINVINVPATETVTAEWSIVK